MNWGAAANALVLNHRLTDRSRQEGWVPDQSWGAACRIRERIVVGRLCDGDGHARLQREHAVSVQSLTIAPNTPAARRRRFTPKGVSHTADATNTCGMSPVESSRSSRRLKLSATGKLATGPVRIDASNTDEASSRASTGCSSRRTTGHLRTAVQLRVETVIDRRADVVAVTG